MRKKTIKILKGILTINLAVYTTICPALAYASGSNQTNVISKNEPIVSNTDKLLSANLKKLSASNENTQENIASKAAAEENYIDSGIFGTAPWHIDSTGTLYIDSGNFGPGGNSDWSRKVDVKKIVFNGPVVANEDSSKLFAYYTELKEIDNLSFLDTSNVTNMNSMFVNCRSLTNIDLSGFQTAKVKDMGEMFRACDTLNSLDLSSFKTSNVINMNYMFGDSYSLINLNLSSFDTSNVTDMSYMFNSCASLTNLMLSNFETSKVTNMSCMFLNCIELSSLDLSNFDTTIVTDMSFMFANNTALNELDLSTFNTSSVTNMENMLFAPIEKLTLGRNFKFIQTSSANLMEPSSDSTYTGKWQNISSGTFAHPRGENVWTSEKFMKDYDGSTDSDTYVWQLQPVAGKDVTVSYVDENSAEIAPSITISGNIGEKYKTEQKVIDGYTFKEVQGSGTGTFTDQAQIVTYVYTKNPLAGRDVTAKYVDTDGNKISDDVVKSGNIGASYTTEQKRILGYTFKEVQGSGTGIFTDQAQIVTYVYTKNPLASGDITAKYIDTDGNKISDDVVKSGNLGDSYTTEQKRILGYTFKEVQGSATGTFTDQSQTVTYVYTKNNMPVNPKIPQNSSHSANRINQDTTSNNLPQTGEKQGIALFMFILGISLIGVSLILAFFKKMKNN